MHDYLRVTEEQSKNENIDDETMNLTHLTKEMLTVCGVMYFKNFTNQADVIRKKMQMYGNEYKGKLTQRQLNFLMFGGNRKEMIEEEFQKNKATFINDTNKDDDCDMVKSGKFDVYIRTIEIIKAWTKTDKSGHF